MSLTRSRKYFTVTKTASNSSSECIGKTLNFNCGLSDVHNIIAFQLKLDVPSKKPRWCTYRSFRNFDVVNFNMDLESNLSQLNFSEDNDVNDAYEAFTNAILSATNKHAPLKKKQILPKPVPYMNKTLKQAIYKKRMLFNKFQKCRNSKNWEKFRQQRNLVTKLKENLLINILLKGVWEVVNQKISSQL